MKQLLVIAMAALAITSCNDSGSLLDNNTPTEITLNGNVQGLTSYGSQNNSGLEQGSKVHVWIDKISGKSQRTSLYADNVLTVGADGRLTGGNPMFYPTDGDSVIFYAVYDNIADHSNFWGKDSTHTVTHTVAQDQTSGTNGYALSDLLYCRKVITSPYLAKQVNLNFDHLLSKLEIVLLKGSETPEISKAEILNTQLTAQLSPIKDSIPFEECIVGYEDGYPIREYENRWKIKAIGDAGSITIDHELTDSDKINTAPKINAAIIVPQDYSTRFPTGYFDFIRLTTIDGKELVCKVDPYFLSNFKPGYKYRFVIEVKDNPNIQLVSMSVSVAPWNEESVDGEAEMK